MIFLYLNHYLFLALLYYDLVHYNAFHYEKNNFEFLSHNNSNHSGTDVSQTVAVAKKVNINICIVTNNYKHIAFFLN